MKDKSLNDSQNLGSKYRSLIIFITLFVMIVVGILVLNIQVSKQFGADAVGINIAGRQRMLSQRIPKTINQLLLKQQNGEDVETTFKELQTAFNLFDETYNAFSEGGMITDASGNRINLPSTQLPAARAALNAAESEWRSYNESLKLLSNNDVSKYQNLSNLVKVFKQNNEVLLLLMNELTNAYSQSGAESLYVNIAGRQRMLSQKLTKHLQDFVDAQASSTEIDLAIQNFIDTKDLFDTTLNAFLNGSETFDTSGNLVKLDISDDPEVNSVLDKSVNVWGTLNDQINEFLNNGLEPAKALRSSYNEASTKNLKLLKLMNDLTVSLQADSEERTDFLRWLQIAGIALALLMFGFIVFYFLRKLTATEADLIAAKGETDRILETVKDGLFLMNPDYSIGGQYSQSLTEIIKVEEPEGKNFLGLLKKIVPEKTLKTAEDYMGLLLGDRVNEDLVKDLNPLDEVEVYYDDDGLDRQVGHLGFEFNRVTGDKDGNISHLLVQVNDITDKILLERQLQESKEKSQEQLDLMLQVLHVNPAQLNQYLADTEEALLNINNVLQKRTNTERANREKLDEIFRLMHRIKGDAAALSLEAFENKAHDFENSLEDIRNKRKITGNDFLPLAINLDDFLGQIDSLRELIKKLSELQNSLNPDIAGDTASSSTEEINEIFDDVSDVVEVVETTEGYDVSNRLNNLVSKISKDLNKEMTFSLRGESHIPQATEKDILDILTQLVRNSAVHGLESKEERLDNDKNPTGHIGVKIDSEDDHISLFIKDDGRGLNQETIKKAAIDKGLVDAVTAESLTRQQVISLIFKPGFSTEGQVHAHAGRGVGMDIVAKQIKSLNGKLSIKSVEGKGSVFALKLPKNN